MLLLRQSAFTDAVAVSRFFVFAVQIQPDPHLCSTFLKTTRGGRFQVVSDGFSLARLFRLGNLAAAKLNFRDITDVYLQRRRADIMQISLLVVIMLRAFAGPVPDTGQ